VEWVITGECDSKCVMCYATKYCDVQDTPLGPDEMKSIWEDCERQGAFISILEGGEPCLRKDIDQIIKVMHPERNIVVIVSNGLALTEERIRHFKKLRVSLLHLSLNSANREFNDRMRGVDGHFDQVMRCVKWAKSAGLGVYFSSILMHSNKEDFTAILDLARRIGIGVSGALMVTQGRYASEFSERLTEEDRQWIMQDLIPQYSDVVRFDWNTNLSGRYECPAGREKVSISLYGEVMACVCNHLSFGNIRQEPILAILSRMNGWHYFKERNERCIVSFDTEYRRKYMDVILDVKKLPINIFEHPKYPAKLVNGKIVN
jgi:MoaA/NifB/PqqE/SkfB family radical SAM enzyme